MPGRFRFLADSPPFTISSTISAPCTTAMARIFASWASSETPWSACLSVETLTYPIARMVHSMALGRGESKPLDTKSVDDSLLYAFEYHNDPVGRSAVTRNLRAGGHVVYCYTFGPNRTPGGIHNSPAAPVFGCQSISGVLHGSTTVLAGSEAVSR